MKKCSYKSYKGIKCDREVYDGSFCILHSEDEKKDREYFYREINEEIKEQVSNNDTISFNYILFPSFFSFADFSSFNKRVSFVGSVFCGLVDFSRVVFHDYCTFDSVQFRCSASFNNVIFEKGVSFRYCKFLGTIRFSRTHFMGSTNFYETNFEENKENNQNSLGKEFPGYDGASALNHILGFPYDGFSFSFASFEGNTRFFDLSFSGSCIDFSNAEIKCKFDFIVRLEVDKLKLNNAEFIGRSNFEISYRKDLIIDAENAYFNDEHGLFSNIKKIHFVTHKFVLGEKTASKFPLIARKARDSWYLDYYKMEHPIIYFIWKHTSNCGRSLLRWASISFMFIFLFALLYSMVGQGGFIHKNEMNFFSYLYFSVVTITTLGFGDIAPSTLIAQILVVGEVIFGYVLLGGLISIFSNKLARRS